MPRKTKEPENTPVEEIKENKKTTTKKRTSTTKKKEDAEAKTTAKKAVTKKATTTTTKKDSDTPTKKNATKKASATTKKTSTKKTTDAKKTSSTAKKTTSKKTSSSATKKKTTKEVIFPIEYYDLPYRYNQTIVKVLAQTPKSLFIYWDISDEDRENYIKTYGDNFFQNTKPVLIIHNRTLDYSFEVDINDFANSWYLHVNDAKCDYSIELGRRPIQHYEEIKTDYIYVASSNEIEIPNNKILFEENYKGDYKKVYYRDVKTNIGKEKTISLVRSMGKVYNIYDLYKKIYKDENIDILANPSS